MAPNFSNLQTKDAGTAMNRRAFLQISLAAAALSSARSLSPLLAQEGAAASSIGLTLAGSIGKSLASGVLGSIGAAAFPQPTGGGSVILHS